MPDFNKTNFEQSLKAAIEAPSQSGVKWSQLEGLAREKDLRVSGTVSNDPAVRRTRIRQTFTTRKHGFSSSGYNDHSVYLLNKDEASKHRADALYLEDIIRDVEEEYTEGDSYLILRHDASATGGFGSLVPLALVIWHESALARLFRKWYPHLRLVDRTPSTSTPSGPKVVVKYDHAGTPTAAGSPLLGLDDVYLRAIAALEAGKHIVLYGPPGTGKTEFAEFLCRHIIQSPSEHYDFATATSEWTTFDTIGGYFPTLDSGDSGETKLDFQAGLITRSFEDERWLVIDELNRADIDKAFGELFTILSGNSVRLPYLKRVDDSGNEVLRPVVLGGASTDTYNVSVPTDWRLICTMNTLDKASLFQLSYAFMRRFAFVEVPVPEPSVYDQLISQFVSAGLGSMSTGSAEKSRVENRLKALFATDTGLRGLGLGMGPAIPKDVVKYLDKRWPSSVAAAKINSGATDIDELVDPLVLEALELYAYPQFEGYDRKQKDLGQLIASHLTLDQQVLDTSLAVLSSWTGAQPA